MQRTKMNSKQIRITELNKTIERYLTNATWCAYVKDGGYQGERLGVIKT